MTAHAYLSTACVHGRHGDCRLTCKFCPAGCRCVCHQPAPTREDPPTDWAQYHDRIVEQVRADATSQED